MGYIKHHAIVVTGHLWGGEIRSPDSDIRDAHAEALRLGLIVTPVIGGARNATGSFLVVPDGSKEGWDASDSFDRHRDRFVEWLRGKSPEGAGWFDWAEVVLGPDDAEAYVARHAWDQESESNQPEME